MHARILSRKSRLHFIRASLVLAVLAGGVGTVAAALESGVYRVQAGATVEERGDRVSEERRIIPFSAIVTLDLQATPPSLTAVLPNAVLEGGEPFPLTVRSATGAQIEDGSYRFMGDYLKDLHPSGTQYLFDWRFASSTNDQVLWNGITGWAGGHFWQITIRDVVLAPDGPTLSITSRDSQVILSWPATFTGFELEQSASLPASSWSTVTNSPAVIAGQFSVTLDPTAARTFYRLRKP